MNEIIPPRLTVVRTEPSVEPTESAELAEPAEPDLLSLLEAVESAKVELDEAREAVERAEVFYQLARDKFLAASGAPPSFGAPND